jgi:hypothetical protein
MTFVFRTDSLIPFFHRREIVNLSERTDMRRLYFERF